MRIKADRRVFVVTPVISTGIYASGDAIGPIQSILKAVSSSDQSGIISSFVISDEDGQDAPLDVIIFESSVTGGSDNAAYAPSQAEVNASVGAFSVLAGDYIAAGALSIATVKPAFEFQFDQSTTLFFQLVSRGTPTYSATDSLQLKFVIDQD